MVRRKSGAVALPWEKPGTWRQLGGGSRWRVAVVAAALFAAFAGLVQSMRTSAV